MKKGFTLIELIISLAVILIIMGVATVYYTNYRNSYMCRNAAELAAYQLRTMQQKTITCELEAGIYIRSDREYWLYTADMVNARARGFMLAGGTLAGGTLAGGTLAGGALAGVGPGGPGGGEEPHPPGETPQYPQHYAPGPLPANMNVIQKVNLDTVRVIMPPVGGRTYFKSGTTTCIGTNIHWRPATPYVYPNEVAEPLVIIMVLKAGSYEKQIVVDQNGRIYVW